jgi:hypothetical protein
MNLTTSTYISSEELAANWTAVASFDEGEFVAYRSNQTGLLRIMDMEFNLDICLSNVFTRDVNHAVSVATKLMSA